MMRCLIIDDEPLAIELLEDFVSKVSFLKLEKSCSSAFEAMELIQSKKIDLIFSDIEMPDFTGIEFIKSLENKPLIIFTTAYSHYAVEGFNLNAVDYLVKPIPFHRFIKAVNRANEFFCLKSGKEFTSGEAPTKKINPDFIFVKSEYENIKVNLNTIKYIEGLKDYIKIYTDKPKPILTLNSLKAFEDKLPSNFIRVHRSFIVSLNHIDSVQRNRIVIGDIRIPIGQNYKDEFIKRIEG